MNGPRHDANGPTTAQCGPLRALVVREEPLRQQHSVLLETQDCLVTVASGGVEAMEGANGSAFDLVVIERNVSEFGADCIALFIRSSLGPSRGAVIIACSAGAPSEPVALIYDEASPKPLTSTAVIQVLRRLGSAVAQRTASARTSLAWTAGHDGAL